MTCSMECGETRRVLAGTEVTREEARVIACIALEDTAYADASRVGGRGGSERRKGWYGYPCGQPVRRRAEERI